MDLIHNIPGIIQFEPEHKTKKHQLQGAWKKTAMVMFEGDIAEYYAWFLNRRYNLILNKPLRGGHISFINDSLGSMKNGIGTLEEKEALWQSVKLKYDRSGINITLSLDPRTDSNHWWLNIPNEYRTELHEIRSDLGLGRPFWGLHMSIGYANERNIHHSKYIHSLLTNGFIQ